MNEIFPVKTVKGVRVVKVLEEWRLIDQWWKPKDEHVERMYAEVELEDQTVVVLMQERGEAWQLVT